MGSVIQSNKSINATDPTRRISISDVQPTEHEEKLSLGSMARSAFSFTSLGVTAWAGMSAYLLAKPYWSKFTDGARKYLSKPMPWESESQSSVAKYTSHSRLKTYDINELTKRFPSPNKQESMNLLNTGLIGEIDLLMSELQSDSNSRKYLDAAVQDTLSSRVIPQAPATKEAILMSNNFDLLYKFRNTLRKYRSLYSKTNRELNIQSNKLGRVLQNTDIGPQYADSMHTNTINMYRSSIIPMDIEFGALKYDRVMGGPDINLYGGRVTGKSIREMLATSTSQITWADRDLYSMTGYKGLSIVHSDAAISRLVNKLDKAVYKAAEAQKDFRSNTAITNLYKIEPRLINQGRGELALSLLVRLKNELASHAGGNDVWTNEEIVLPLGNTGGITLGEGGLKLVGGLHKPTGSTKWYNVAGQYAKLVEGEIDSIVSNLVGGTEGMKKNWSQRVGMLIRRRTQLASNGATDVGARLTLINEDWELLSRPLESSEKARITKNLYQMKRRFNSLKISSPTNPLLNRIQERIDICEKQLGIGIDAPEKVKYMWDLMSRQMKDEGLISVPWETTASHMGRAKLLEGSIFGVSPWSTSVVPQSSAQQFWNTYELGTKYDYPMTWEGEGPLTTKFGKNFMTARVGLVGDMYPYNEAYATVSPAFAKKLSTLQKMHGNRRIIKLNKENGKVKVHGSQVGLMKLINEVESKSREYGVMNEDVIDNIVKSANVIIPSNSPLGADADTRTGVDSSVVRKITDRPDEGQVWIELESTSESAIRVKSALGGRTVPFAAEIKLTKSLLDANRPLDMILRTNITKRLTMEQFNIMQIADAIESNRINIREMSAQVNKLMIGSTKRRILEQKIRESNDRLQKASQRLGGTYNTTNTSIDLPGVLRPGSVKVTTDTADEVLRILGHVYTESEAREVRNYWDTQRPILEKLIDKEGLPPSFIDKMMPKAGSPARFRFFETGGIKYLGPILFDVLGIMKQTHEEMLNTFGLKTGVNAGIPYRWMEAQQLVNKYLEAPTPMSKEWLSATEQYVSYLINQMGGEDSAKEINNILRQMTGSELPPGSDVVSVKDTKFRTALANTKIPGNPNIDVYHIISDEHHNVVKITPNLDEVADAMRNDPNSVRTVPAYRVNTKDMGIFHPETGYLNKWIDLGTDIKYDFGGIGGRSRYMRMMDPDNIKIKPTIFNGPQGEYAILPSQYGNLFKIFDSMKDHTGGDAPRVAVDNAHKIISSTIRDFFLGRHSQLKMDEAMTYESGIQGIMMPLSQPYKHNNEIRWIGGVRELRNPNTGARVKWGEEGMGPKAPGPLDVVVSRKTFQGVKEVIRQNLMEKYTDSNKQTDWVKVEAELTEIEKGNKWTPTMGVRFPKTGSHASIFGRLWVAPKLDKMGYYSDFLYVGEMIQKAMWGDYDYDQIMLMLAKHRGGLAGVESLLEEAGKHGDFRIYEGTPEYEYFKMGETTYGSGTALDKYRTEYRRKVGDKIDTIKIPRIYKVVPVDKNLGYAIATHIEKYDTATRRKYIDSEVKTFIDPATGKPLYFQPGEWVDTLKATIDEGKELSMNDIDMLNNMPPDVQARIKANKKFSQQLAIQMERQGLNQQAVWGVKGIVGSANSFAMGLNLAAMNHLEPREAAQVAHQMSLWIESVLKMKRVTGKGVNSALEGYGTFVRSMEHLTNVEDVFGKMLTRTPDEGGLGMPRSTVELLAKMPTRARKSVYSQLSYKLLYATSEPEITNVPNTGKMWASLLGSPDEDILQFFRGESRRFMGDEFKAINRGTAIHTMYKSLLPNQGLKQVLSEGRVVDPNTGVTGRIDMVVQDDAGDKYIHEVKSVKSEIYEKMRDPIQRNKLVSNQHIQQLNFYLGRMGDKVKGGYLVYVNQNNPSEMLSMGDPMTGQPFQYNEIMFNHEMSRVRKLEELATNKSIADPVIKTLGRIVSNLNGSDPDAVAEASLRFMDPDVVKYFKGLDIPKSASNYSYFKSKPFMGNIFRRTPIDDTLLADAVGPKWYPSVKYGVWAAAMIAGTYTALNFFRPNQMGTLGKMPGLGGEYWTPLKGSRMELPYHVPIDVNSYTWESPPYDRKKARIELYDPNFEDKLARRITKIEPSTYPMTNWGLAPKSSVLYNSSNNNEYNRNSTRSSNMIGRY